MCFYRDTLSGVRDSCADFRDVDLLVFVCYFIVLSPFFPLVAVFLFFQILIYHNGFAFVCF